MKQSQLLNEPLWNPKAADGRDAPAFWVRRMVFVDDLKKLDETTPFPVMDRRFHRGLNIIWADEARGGGHGAGKTTLCQLIRYCLGEPGYGSERLNKNLAKRFPNGYIGAEVMLGEVCWAILRPVSLHEKKAHPSRCRENSTLEELLQGFDEAGDYSVFHEAFRECLLKRVANLPGDKQEMHLLADRFLAWLTRDQDAHYEDLHAWRKASSGSGVKQPQKKEDGHHLIRHVLGLISPDETEARKEAEKAEGKVKKAKADHQGVVDEIARAKLILSQAFGVPKEKIADDGDLLDLGGVQFLRTRFEEESKAASDLGDDPRLRELRKEENRLRQEYGRSEQRVTRLFEECEEKKSQAVKEGQVFDGLVDFHDNLTLDPVCDMCNHTLSDVLVQFGQVDTSKSKELQKIEGRKAAAKQRKTKFDTEAGQLQIRLNTAQLECQSALAKLNAAEKESGQYEKDLWRKRQEHSTAAARFQMAVSSFEALGPKQKSREEAKAALDTTERDHKAIIDRIVNGFAAHEENRRKLEHDFRRLTHRILRDSYIGSLRVTRDGFLEPIWRRKTEEVSTALDSLRVIVFDLAAFLSGIEGVGGFPGFLLHDSPRESDLMLRTYHFIFEEMKRWTEAFGKDAAPFQYIITTTTQPPDGLQGPEWVNQPVLDSSTADGRLLKIDIGEE